MKNANKIVQYVNNIIGDIMHNIKINDNLIRTDLLLEQKKSKIKTNESYYKGIKTVTTKDNSFNYTTIFFDDITDYSSSINLEKVFSNELCKYLKLSDDDIIIIIGLGNEKSTPDSLGPLTIDKIFPTRYLFELGDVEEGYTNVSIYKPDVIGNTGIESSSIIKSLIDEVNPTKIIIIDSLKANNIERLTKTIQITDSGINPGSGINNSRGEISKKTLNKEVIAIGIPTVVDIKSLIDENMEESFIVTPTNIDFIIEKLSTLLAKSLNKNLHKNYNRQINN